MGIHSGCHGPPSALGDQQQRHHNSGTNTSGLSGSTLASWLGRALHRQRLRLPACGRCVRRPVDRHKCPSSSCKTRDVRRSKLTRSFSDSAQRVHSLFAQPQTRNSQAQGLLDWPVSNQAKFISLADARLPCLSVLKYEYCTGVGTDIMRHVDAATYCVVRWQLACARSSVCGAEKASCETAPPQSGARAGRSNGGCGHAKETDAVSRSVNKLTLASVSVVVALLMSAGLLAAVTIKSH